MDPVFDDSITALSESKKNRHFTTLHLHKYLFIQLKKAT